MLCRSRKLLTVLALSATLAFNQGLNTPSNPNDWEEINFDFDSSVLVDGFPSLLRLAELLQSNPGYRVQIEGYTDRLGSAAYNQTLGLARANAVRDFLLKYGATPAQLTTSTKGASSPRVSDQGSTYRKTDEARFMNRRVALSIKDSQGNPITGPNSSPGDAIRAINGQAGPATAGAPQAGAAKPQAGAGAGAAPGAGTNQANPTQAGMSDCCDQVLKRLDKLDEIANLMKDLADQNAQLRRDLDGLKQTQQAMQNAMQQAPAAPAQPVATAQAAATAPLAGQSGSNSGSSFGQNNSNPFLSRVQQQMSFNVGADDRGKVAVSGRGRFFAPIGTNFGFQAQAEYYYLRGQREGQFDFGVVDRFNRRFQAGLFGSFKTVSLTNNQNSGTLGQASFVLDYFFGRGKIGLFGSKAFMDNALVNRANGVGANGLVQRNIIEERFLKVVEQVGLAGTVGLIGNTYAEANVGYLRSTASSNRMGGSLRLVMPVSDHVAFTVEGGVNETYLPFKGTQQGRAAVGVQLGNFLRPKEYLAADHAVAMEIPRVRYETLTRRTRTGNDAPVADAGPDLSNVGAGVIQLDGSNSSDPDGDPITYQWVQETGPSSPMSGATTAKAAFTAVAGQVYSFRLTVKDDQGGQSSDRVQISALGSGSGSRVQILSFTSDPRQISGGQTSTLSWNVLNADSITISGIGEVSASGNRQVTPSTTSTYILTAKNAISEETATTTIVLNSARFLTCYASPATIRAGETSTLSWQSNGANGVSIAPTIGSVGANGSVAVTPTTNTTYTLTTTGGSQTDSCTVTVGVNPATGGGSASGKPSITRFSASPRTIEKGEKTELAWAVVGADSISISTEGGVPQFGTRQITPQQSTTYVLTATNGNGTVTAEVQVTVFTIPPPVITSFTADRTTVAFPGAPVQLSCNTTGAVTVMIGPNAQFFTANPTLEAFPPKDTTYACLATNSKGETTTQSLTIKVGP